MKRPDDPLAPREHCFAEPWHAQTLAAAQALIRAGAITANEWADALGLALQQAETAGAPDTEDTYYNAALTALERVAPISDSALQTRKSEWEDAYRRTPHGHPVSLTQD